MKAILKDDKKDIKIELPTEKLTEEVKEPKVVKNEKKKETTYKVVHILNPKAVMVRDTKDNKLFSKPNKGYRLGQIIK